MMTTGYRNEPSRNHIIHSEFLTMVAASMPHMRPEAEMKGISLWGHLMVFSGGSMYCRSSSPSHPLLGKIARAGNALDKLGDLLKRRPVTAEVRCAVDGDLPAKFVEALTAYTFPGRKRVATEMSFTIGDTSIELNEGNGRCRINKGVVFGAESDFNEFKGRVVIDKDLAQNGGPFAVDIQTDCLRLVSLKERVRTWKLTLSAIRENGFCIGGFGYSDLIHRLRSGTRIAFKKNGRSTQVIIASGKADPQWQNKLKIRIARVARWKDALVCHEEALKRIGREAAAEFCADELNVREEKLREIKSAQESFNSDSIRLLRVMEVACYKKDIPAQVYVKHPGYFPSSKCVSTGVSSDYKRSKATFTSSWERLQAALKTRL